MPRLTAPQLLAGILLDFAFGDPQWLPHPVRGIGWLATKLENFWRKTRLPLRPAGLLFSTSVVTLSALAVRCTLPWLTVYWIYALLAARDLDIESGRVVQALQHADLTKARNNLSMIVGRDTATLNEPEILRATFETVAENLSDGVIAPLFYLAIAGPVGMMAYKAVNTLDSMVGHRNQRYHEFGWASARLDDIANFVPSRLTAVLIWAAAALLPGFSARRSFSITLRDGRTQPSPNAGYPEAAFAGALGVQFGGLNIYAGVPSPKPLLGDPLRPLNILLFRRVRILLYTTEALFAAILLRRLPWR